jgi:O-antigen/teichoic acid export membrane protein
VLSFVKQVFNYLFVAVNKQTLLFYVNLIGIVCGIILALFVIPKRNLIGGVITQITLECLFTI